MYDNMGPETECHAPKSAKGHDIYFGSDGNVL